MYTSSKNEEIIKKLIKQNGLRFEVLFVAKPHVFISSKHPLAEREELSLEDLEEYPYLSFEQGEYNSFYFSEEILSTLDRSRNIKLWVNPDCGLKTRGTEETESSLKNLVEAVRIVRKRLG